MNVQVVSRVNSGINPFEDTKEIEINPISTSASHSLHNSANDYASLEQNYFDISEKSFEELYAPEGNLELQKSLLCSQIGELENQLEKSQLRNEAEFLGTKISIEGFTPSNAAEGMELLNKLKRQLEKLGTKKSKQEILTSLQKTSDNFKKLATQLDELKKLAETVQYKKMDDSLAQADVKNLLVDFQAELKKETKSFVKQEKDVRDVRLVRLGNEKLNSDKKGEASKKMLEDFTKIWSEIATMSRRADVEAKYVSLRIADLPMMEDLVDNMKEQTKKIENYIHSPELTDVRWGVWHSVKDEKKEAFSDFVHSAAIAYKNAFSTLLELGRAISITRKEIANVDAKEDYAKGLGQGSKEQKALNIKNFKDISEKGNKANEFLKQKYATACAALVKANDDLNYQNSYIQAIAADPSMTFPWNTTWSVASNPNMKVNANLIKIDVPVVVAEVKAEVKEEAKVEVKEENVVDTLEVVTEEKTLAVEDIIIPSVEIVVSAEEHALTV